MRSDCPTQIFSLSNGDAFIEYVKSLEAAADPQILSDVREGYGEDWPTPFLTMYDRDSEREERKKERRSVGPPT